MEPREYRIRFLTPAFLGNAEQNGQWRTPPFKALLRQWWRVAWSEENGYSNDIRKLRAAEGALFGAAADGSGNRSLVRLRLGRWDTGELKSWDRLEQSPVHHKEVQKTGYKVGPHAYLGFGPLDGRGGTKLSKPNAAIQDGESAQLRLAFPADQAPLLDAALALMARYGTLGGRSRNGWGSFELISKNGFEGTHTPTRHWRDCLDRDWPHALGSDDQGTLIWQTAAFDDWKALMRRLAEIKIGLRTQFKFPDAKPPHKQVQPRHWLSYPITTHRTSAWQGGARLPNSLRFKVRADADGRLRGVIFHVPCKPPAQFGPDRHLRQIEQVWQQVHGYLDNAGLERIPA